MYLDYATINEDAYVASEGSISKMKGGVAMPFPQKLHKILDQGLHAEIISWAPHGRCLLFHKPKLFVEIVLPKYFDTTKMTSFKRQLNLYGFTRLLSDGIDKGGYYHEKFLRSKSELCKLIKRTPCKGWSELSPCLDSQHEPSFYSMFYLPEIRRASDHNSSASDCRPSHSLGSSSSKKTSEISPTLYIFHVDPASPVHVTGFDCKTRSFISEFF